ncbi:MAG: DUF3667 domain-containing protein [Flavobacteriaceae bacterium]|jgi:hypothetical protein|nr:DUF3667 domain-containing protein [Flavobacteriaceae bacterium]
MNCTTCQTEVTTPYCPTCGQAPILKRIDSHYLIHEIGHVLHFEKGIFYTIKELLIKPGNTVRKFIVEDRSRLVKPVIFVIIASLIYSIIAHYFHMDSFVAYANAEEGISDKVFQWGDSHSGYMNVIIGVFIAMWAKLFFKKYGFNLFEILILLCFVSGMSMIIFAVFAIAEGITAISLMPAAGVVGIIYCTWAIAQFFDGLKAINYVKAFFAYVLGMLTFVFSVIVIGGLIDWLLKLV